MEELAGVAKARLSGDGCLLMEDCLFLFLITAAVSQLSTVGSSMCLSELGRREIVCAAFALPTSSLECGIEILSS
jgi:hypothetical protein